MQNRIKQARKEYEEALKIDRELAHKNPETYLMSQLMLSTPSTKISFASNGIMRQHLTPAPESNVRIVRKFSRNTRILKRQFGEPNISILECGAHRSTALHIQPAAHSAG